MRNYILLFLSVIFLLGLNSCKKEPSEIVVSNPILVNFFSDVVHLYDDEGLIKSAEIKEKIIVDDEHFTITMIEMDREAKILPNYKTTWGTTLNTTTWLQGDSLGIFMQRSVDSVLLYTNILYKADSTAKSTSLSPGSLPIYITNPSILYDFFAYYPYSSTINSTNLSYTLPTNQTLQSTVNDADWMASAVKQVSGSNPNVNFSFNHAMALLSFQLKSNSLAGRTLSKLTVSGSRITNKGTFNIKTATAVPNTTVVFSPYSNVNKVLSSTSYIYTDIIINPCTIGNNSGSQLKLTITVNGTNYTTFLTKNISFTSGKRYFYTITVKS